MFSFSPEVIDCVIPPLPPPPFSPKQERQVRNHSKEYVDPIWPHITAMQSKLTALENIAIKNITLEKRVKALEEICEKQSKGIEELLKRMEGITSKNPIDTETELQDPEEKTKSGSWDVLEEEAASSAGFQ